MAASKDQALAYRDGAAYGYGVKAVTIIYARTIVALTAGGLAVPAGHADAVVIAGVAKHHADNRDGFDGDGVLPVMKGDAYPFAFDAAPAYADIGKPVYAIDDNTVSLSDSGGTRLLAGTLDGIEGGTAWTRI